MAPALERAIERTDFPTAERWLEQPRPVRREHHVALAGAELTLAVVREAAGLGGPFLLAGHSVDQQRDAPVAELAPVDHPAAPNFSA